MNAAFPINTGGVLSFFKARGSTKASPIANCDLRTKRVVRAKDCQPGKGRAA